jgi:hypothetical protein
MLRTGDYVTDLVFGPATIQHFSTDGKRAFIRLHNSDRTLWAPVVRLKLG